MFITGFGGLCHTETGGNLHLYFEELHNILLIQNPGWHWNQKQEIDGWYLLQSFYQYYITISM